MKMHVRAGFTMALAFATASSAISVLLPLYTYPCTTTPTYATAWQPVFDAITNYTSINFYLVVDISNGPWCSVSTCPKAPNETCYAAAINYTNSLATKYRNVFMLGYVATGHASRAYSAVKADIDTYASWGNYASKTANYSMAGIFFDEMNNTAGSAYYTYYKNASSYAYAHVPSDTTPVVFNPGTKTPATTFFNYADFIVQDENAYSTYQNQTTINAFPSGYNSQTAILLHDTPVGTDLTSYIHTMIKDSIGAVYFCPDGNYADLSMLNNVTAVIKKG